MPYFKMTFAIALLSGSAYMAYEIALLVNLRFHAEYTNDQWSRLFKALAYCVVGMTWGVLWLRQSWLALAGS